MDSFGWGKTRKVIAEDAVSVPESTSQSDPISKEVYVTDNVPDMSASSSSCSEGVQQKQLDLDLAQDKTTLERSGEDGRQSIHVCQDKEGESPRYQNGEEK
ncbi:hypothetical protein Plec18170_008756 [Paecilomyces lecythidis]